MSATYPETPGEHTPDLGPVRGQPAIAGLAPFGLGQGGGQLPRALGRALWQSRGRLAYTMAVLTQGVCDACPLGPRGLRDDVLDGLHLCARRLERLRRSTLPSLAPADLLDVRRLSALDPEALIGLGRLSWPFLRRRGERGFRKVSWDEALQSVRDLARDVPGERVGLLADPDALNNESAYALVKAARLLGARSPELCAAPGELLNTEGLAETLGAGSSTCSLSDLVGADLVLVLGTALAEAQPVALGYLVEAKARGARIVAVGSRLDPGLDATWAPRDPVTALFGARLADDHLPVREGGELALLQGALKRIDELGAVDADFIESFTQGWAPLREGLRAARWEALEAASGLSRQEMGWLGELLARAGTCVSLFGVGLTRGEGARDRVAALVHLHLARGTMGRPKCGILALRGSAGEQGALECGLGSERQPGQGAGPLLDAAARGEIDVLYALGADLRRPLADPGRAEAALARPRLRVHQLHFLEPSALLEPGELTVLLPSQDLTEQRGGASLTSVERRIRFSPEIVDDTDLGERRPAWEIPSLFALALRPQLASDLTWTDAAEIRAEMAEALPRYEGIELLGQAGDWVQWGGPQLYGDGRFPDLPEERARFLPLPTPPPPEGS